MFALFIEAGGMIIMAKDRIEPCESYICKGECKKGRDADHNGYCQKCGKYKPRVRKRHIATKEEAIVACEKLNELSMETES